DAVLVLGEGAPGREIAHHTARQGRALIAAKLVPVDPPDLTGRKVLAFAGIGRPAKFFDTVRTLGTKIVLERIFADHHPYTDAEAAELIKLAGDNDLLLVTTEKDHARLVGATATQDVLAEQSIVLAVEVRFEDRRQIERLIGRTIERATLRTA
ncbi:MAG: tetraacyldisaccharide 4'-kinase, partial [Hyphomicrobiales bacterium]|nr:tetraacyldisaccharide 4'-kinase [Hyphomicrobiales bacterium]